MKRFLFVTICSFFFSFCYSQDLTMANDEIVEYNIVELRPEFPEYSGNFMEFIAKNFSLPDYDGPTGNLKVGFIIEPTGVVTNVKVLKNLDTTSSSEIKKVMSKCPKWKPAEHNGKPVRVYYEFSLKLSGNS